MYKKDDKLIIEYKANGVNIIIYVVCIVMFLFFLRNIIVFVVPLKDQIFQAIGTFLINIVLFSMITLLAVAHLSEYNKSRKIVFDNKNRQISDDDQVYSYDDIKAIEVVSYNEYKDDIDRKAIDTTTVKNYLTTSVARVSLANKTIALNIGFKSKGKQMVKEIKKFTQIYDK